MKPTGLNWQADLLWEFDRKIAAGFEPDWDAFLEPCDTPEHAAELCAAMIRCELEHAGWSLARIRDRLKVHAKYDPTDMATIHLVRGIYSDRLERGEPPELSDFETLGFAAELLELRVEGDPLFLKQEVAGRYRIEERVGSGDLELYSGPGICSKTDRWL